MNSVMDKEIFSLSLFKKFLDKSNISYSENFDLSKVCHIRAGGVCLYYVSPRSKDELQELSRNLNELDLRYIIVGRLSNTLFRSGLIRTIIISTTKMKNVKRLDEGELYLDSGVNLPKIAKIVTEEGYSGFGGLTGFPASIGGAIYMNASCYGNAISDYLVNISCLAVDGSIVTLNREEVGFNWRYSKFHDLYKDYIILGATFQLKKMIDTTEKQHLINTKINRSEFQEHKLPNLGSTFATLDIYGDIATSNKFYKLFYFLINLASRLCGRNRDKVWATTINKFTQLYFGIKERNGVGFSDKTMNCVVNKSGATADDLIEFVYYVKNKIGNVVDIEIKIYDTIY